MDDHSLKVVAGLLVYYCDGADWKFERLNSSEQRIIGNQVQLDILRKFANNEFEKAIGEA